MKEKLKTSKIKINLLENQLIEKENINKFKTEEIQNAY